MVVMLLLVVMMMVINVKVMVMMMMSVFKEMLTLHPGIHWGLPCQDLKILSSTLKISYTIAKKTQYCEDI